MLRLLTLPDFMDKVGHEKVVCIDVMCTVL
jgi:hypothetical protein